MNVEYSGAQSRQRPTLISDLDGITGPYYSNQNPSHVQLNRLQNLCFPNENCVTANDGPFWMSQQKKLETRFDVYEDIPADKQKEIPKTKQELIHDLLEANIKLNSCCASKWKAKELFDIATVNNINTKKTN